MSMLRPILPLLRYQWVINLLKGIVGAAVKGPKQDQIEQGICHIVGEVATQKARSVVRTPPRPMGIDSPSTACS